MRKDPSKPGLLQAEIEAFYAQTRARALLIAVEWAGSGAALAASIGSATNTGSKWLQRGHIPLLAALQLEKLPGFPLTAEEICPGEEIVRARSHCPFCLKTIKKVGESTGYRPLLKARLKAAKHKAQHRARRAAQQAFQAHFCGPLQPKIDGRTRAGRALKAAMKASKGS